MGFRENLRQKMLIDKLSAKVRRTMAGTDSGQRIDRDAMRRLIELGGYTFQRERDLDLYIMGSDEGRPRILLLDNELKIYATSPEDIALRKSPTVKEMVSIRNAIKILNDKDVVVSRKADSLDQVQQELIAALDMSYTAADIDALAEDGRSALKNNYADGAIEILELFAELLAWRPAPRAFQVAHHKIWGGVQRKEGGKIGMMGPLVIFSLMQNSLKMITAPVSGQDPEAMDRFHLVVNGETQADHEGAEVFKALHAAVMAEGAE